MTKYLISIGFVAFLLMSVSSQDLKLSSKFPEVLDGTVKTIAVDEEYDRIYIGGDFSEPLESAEGFKSFYDGISVSTGLPSVNLPEVNDTIYNIVPDGLDGYFICGGFDKVNNFKKASLVQINSINQITALSIEVNGPVYDVLKDTEENILYIGGDFTSVNGEKRNNLCAIDLIAYDLLDWNPDVNGRVYELEEKGDSIFIGGTFSGFGKLSKNIIYNPDLSEIVNTIETNRDIYSIIPDGEGGVFLAGNFTEINGIFREAVAQIDASGNLTDFSVNLGILGLSPSFIEVQTLVLEEGNLYIGGLFDNINSIPRENAAAIDLESGLILPWSPNPNNRVYKLGVFRDSILVGGGFSNINESFEDRNLALVDKIEGHSSLTFNFPWEDNFFWVYDFVINDPYIHVAGGFPGFNVTNACVTFNVDSKEDIPISAINTLNGNVNALALKGDTLFIGGNFTQAEQMPGAQSLAALNWQTGDLYDWAPDIDQAIGARGVDELKIVNDNLYVGGNFFRVDGKPRQLVASYNPATLNLNDLSLSYTASGNARTSCVLLESIYGNLYISATAFVNEKTRYNFAGVNKSGGILDISIPFSTGNQLSGFENSAIYSIEIVGDTAFVAGDYTTTGFLNESTNFALANLSTGNGIETGFEVNDVVRVVKRDEDKLYLGGEFTLIDGLSKNKIARVDLSSNQVDDWQLDLSGESVNTIEIMDDHFFIGGTFNTVLGQDRSNIALLSKSDFSLNPITANTNGDVYSLLVNGDVLVSGGAFSRFGSSQVLTGSNFLVLDKSSGVILQIESFPNGAINEVVIEGDKVFLAGSFNQIGTSDRPGIAALNRDLLTVSDWGENLPLVQNFEIQDIELDDDRVYFVAGNKQSNLGALDRDSGSLLDWPADSYNISGSSNGFFSIVASDTSVFVGGQFFTAPPGGGSGIDGIIEIGKESGELTTFRVVETQGPFGTYRLRRVTDMVIFNNDLIIAGRLEIGGEGIAKIDIATGEMEPLPNAGLSTGADGSGIDDSRLFVTGRELFLSNSTLYFAADAYAAAYDLSNNQYSTVYTSDDWYDIVFDGGPFGSPRWDPIYSAFSITADSDGNVYVGGDFEQIIQKDRLRFASITNGIDPIGCETPAPGTISTNSVTRDICLNNEALDIVQAEVSGSTDNSVFILHDSNYEIFSIRPSGIFKPDNHPPGNYFVSHMAYTDDVQGPVSNLNDLDGCLSVSGSFAVTSFRAEAGLIGSSDPKNYCVGDLPATISFDRINSSGINQGFILLNNSNQILQVSIDGSFVLEDLNPGNYKVASVSTDETVILEDIQASNLDPCFDYSNLVRIDIETCEELLIVSNPNPVVDISNVTFTTVESKNVQLELFDLTGKRIGLIYAGMAPGQTPMMFQYDTSALPQGVYIYKLTTESEVKTSKFLKN